MVEMLVVVSVVVVLGALCYPAFNSARRKAHQKTCVANLQQISHALSLYTADYDGIYPQTVAGNIDNGKTLRSAPVWADALAMYAHRDLPACPARPSVSVVGPANVSGDLIGYALNSHLNSRTGTRSHYTMRGYSEQSLRYPTCTIAVFDARCGIYEALRPDTAQSREELAQSYSHIVNENSQYPFLQHTPGAFRHQGRANYAFVDGHVKWLSPSEIAIDPQNDGIRPGFGL